MSSVDTSEQSEFISCTKPSLGFLTCANHRVEGYGKDTGKSFGPAHSALGSNGNDEIQATAMRIRSEIIESMKEAKSKGKQRRHTRHNRSHH